MKNWRYIEEDHATAAYGLAADEFLMNAAGSNDQAALRLYTYRDHCLLVGRFQNIHAELDLEACEKAGFQYSRRLTGGGTIIMGQDQLGVCVALPSGSFPNSTTRDLYQILSSPIVKALEKLGIEASLRGKNDLEVGGKKIAGLGIHVSQKQGGWLQFHASLLADLDIPLMLQMLNIPLQKLADKGIHKVEQRMTTVSRELNRKAEVGEIRALVKHSFEEHLGISLLNAPFSETERHQIARLENERYAAADWIFQNSPQPDMTGMGMQKTAAGLLRAYVALKGETFKSVLVTGDFFESETLFKNIETRLKWQPLDRALIEREVEHAFAQHGQKYSGLLPGEVSAAIWKAALGVSKEAQHTYQGACFT